MSLPAPEKIDAAVQAVSSATAAQISILGFNLDASEVAAVVQAAVDALCMKAWRQAQAAGAAAAAAITTEAEAEAAQRTP